MSTTDKSVPLVSPKGHWFVGGHRRYRFHDFIVETGYVTSWIFTILMLLVPFFGDYLHGMHKWIAIWYLVFQLLEILARNHLKMWQVLKDHAFSLAPVLVGVVYTVMYWQPASLSPETREVLNFWHFVAWVDLIFGIMIGIVILNAPYQREESSSDT